jgi:hypothetical protein
MSPPPLSHAGVGVIAQGRRSPMRRARSLLDVSVSETPLCASRRAPVVAATPQIAGKFAPTAVRLQLVNQRRATIDCGPKCGRFRRAAPARVGAPIPGG